ncbi:N-acetyltransferase GCN5 [Actinorhabdospora filicis]|uniref:N-acetyltransferase GCN5 n=2 Tax=Actinorhabdospora filicis TaxID=1785913 RepID=A0A9W6SGB6_9ACTN|nr:N-acetyltransferase GCN5 [Actinorhabdospora filicis]
MGWPVVLTEGRLSLRPYKRSDARAWSDLRRANEGWLSRWEPTSLGSWHDTHTVASFRALHRELKRTARAGTAMPFAVCWDGNFVGQLTVGNIVRRAFRSAYIGYWVDKGHAGLGIIPTSVALVVDHCFSRGGLHRIEVNIQPDNRPSQRVVEKLGFRKEALHERYLYIDGAWRDHIGYAVTMEDVLERGGMMERARGLLKAH